MRTLFEHLTVNREVSENTPFNAMLLIFGGIVAFSLIAFLVCYANLLKRINDHRPGITLSFIAAALSILIPMFGGIFYREEPPEEIQKAKFNTPEELAANPVPLASRLSRDGEDIGVVDQRLGGLTIVNKNRFMYGHGYSTRVFVVDDNMRVTGEFSIWN